jgi:hypothetical protein
MCTALNSAATIARRRGKTQIYVQATGLPASTNTSGYAVWLYNSSSDRRSLGAASTDQRGNLQGMGELHLEAEDTTGRRNRISTVKVSRVPASDQEGRFS